MARRKTHKQQVDEALKDKYLQTALKRATTTYRKSRDKGMAGFDLARSQDEVREIKERSIAKMDALLARFKEEAEDVDAVVHEATDGEEAARIVCELARERGVELIVKSKSMLTEEIELNPRLEEAGFKVVETDLGEWIIQLAGEKPSHFTQPAIHKTREQVAELFSKVTGEKLEPDVDKLVAVARKHLRQAFIDADMGISGANVAIAETGGIVIVSNEGNDRLVTTLPPIHVAIVGCEKLVETLDDANAILKVLARSGTGQKQTAYVSFITGPSRTTDIEKTLTLGVHGPKELHIIFVDAGRKAMAEDNECVEALYCIKCGACLNMCPVYKSVGGHAFGNAYVGGIGAVLTAYHRNLDDAADTLGLCAGCGYCTTICPSKIRTPDMILNLRKRLLRTHGMPLAGRISTTVLRHPRLFHATIRTARSLQGPALNPDGTFKDLSAISAMAASKKLPGLARRFLRDILPERSSETGKMAVTLYAGCMIDFFYPEIGEAMWKVLTSHDVQAIFPRDQSCCGAPALYLGDRNTARKTAVDNLLAAETGSPVYVITGCPTCAIMFKEHFPALLRGTAWEERAVKLAEKVLDFSQFAAEVLDIRPAQHRDGTITYHDPCHQVRSLGTSECSRSLIERAGMDLVEMANCDECCGFAGSYSIKQAGVSNAILNRKIANIEATGASMLATDCPGCIMQINGGLMKRESPIKVCHTAQLIASLLE